MIQILRNKSIASIIVLLITAILVHFHLLIQPIGFAAKDVGYLQFFLEQYQQKIIPQVWVIFYFILIFSQALQLNLLLGNGKMFTKNGFTTAFAYLLITGVFKEFSTINAALIINSLLIWTFAKTISLYNNPNPKPVLFNIGLLIAICIALYPPCIILLLFMIFGYAIMRAFKITELLTLLLGFCSVFYIILSIMFLQDTLPQAKIFIPDFKMQFTIPKSISYIYWLNFVSLFLLFIVGFFVWLPVSNRMVIQSRKNWGVMLLLFAILCLYSLLFNYNTSYFLMVLIIPIASFASNFFLYPKRKFFIYVVLLFIIVVVAVNNNYWLSSK